MCAAAAAAGVAAAVAAAVSALFVSKLLFLVTTLRCHVFVLTISSLACLQ